MEYSISPILNEDRESVIDIFNYYVENSFAAYPEEKFPYQAFDMFLRISNGFPTGSIRDQNGKIVGFGMLRTHNTMPTFSQTAEVTYFIHPDHTGKDLGKWICRVWPVRESWEEKRPGIRYSMDAKNALTRLFS